MSTVVRLRYGPADHGRPVTAADLEEAEYEPGFGYEVIDGRLCVCPQANSPEAYLTSWLYNQLVLYSGQHRDVIDYVTGRARVYVPNRPDLTVPEPDLAAYVGYPHHLPVGEMTWEGVSPVVVVEVLVDGDPQKDLVRNVSLYFEVQSIQEYWLIDGRENPAEPLFVARRRHGRRWVVTEVPFGETYSTRNLPGFELLIDPRTR